MYLRNANEKDEKAVISLLESYRLKPEFLPKEFVIADVEGEVVGCACLKRLDDSPKQKTKFFNLSS